MVRPGTLRVLDSQTLPHQANFQVHCWVHQSTLQGILKRRGCVHVCAKHDITLKLLEWWLDMPQGHIANNGMDSEVLVSNVVAMLASCSIDPVCTQLFPITSPMAPLHKDDCNTILPAVIKGVESFSALLTPWLMLMGSDGICTPCTPCS